MVWETKRHEDEIRSLKYKIDSLSSEMSSYSTQRVEKETKIIELDHLIGQLLNVNETLVQQLSKSSFNHPTSKKLKQKSTILPNDISSTDGLKKKKKRSVSAPRVAEIGTVSSDLKSSMIKNGRDFHENNNGHNNDDNNSNNNNSINRLHDMHNMYVTLAQTITGKKETGRNVKNRRAGQGGVLDETEGSGKGKKKETSIKQRLKRDDGSNVGGSEIGWRDRDDDISSRYSERSAPSFYPTESNSIATADLQRVIQSLEEEFEGLSNEYNRLLNGNSVATGEDKSRELVSVIQRLHRKGEQLRALKSSPIKG